jgi:pimeloyl-ACP methyl ester carboxylesterase
MCTMKKIDCAPTNLVRRRLMQGAVAALGCSMLGTSVASTERRTYCLLHGSTHGAGGWRWLARELRGLGHRVVTPSVPYEDPAASTGRCISAIDAQLREVSVRGPLVVVAHSISGLLLPAVAARNHAAQLVYIAAAVPAPGLSFRQQFERAPDMYWADWVEAGHRSAQDEAIARRFLYHDCEPSVVEEIKRHRIQFAAKRIWLDVFADRHPAIPARYLVCAQDRVFQPAWMRRTARETVGVTPEEFASGHCPHLAAPKALAQALSRDTGPRAGKAK